MPPGPSRGVDQQKNDTSASKSPRPEILRGCFASPSPRRSPRPGHRLMPRGPDPSVAEITLSDDSSPKSARPPSLVDWVPDPSPSGAPPPPRDPSEQLRDGSSPRSRLGSPRRSVTKAEAERRAREEREYWDGWYRLLTCGTAPNPRDAERGRGAGAGVAGYADSDDEEEDATGRHTGGRCRVHGLGLGCAISCCCLKPNRRSRSFQDLRESVSPRTSPRTSPRPSPSRPTRR